MTDEQQPETEHYAFPASLAQERIWFLQQLDPASTAYNMPTALRMRGEFDVGRFGTAIDAVVERHEILRTAFRHEDGRLLQIVLPGVRCVPEVIDASGDAEAVLQRVRVEADRPFDLTRAPLLRIVVLRIADDDHIVVFSMHHIISDAWSLGVLVRDLAKVYLGGAEPEELPIQYADYSVWQRDWLKSEERDKQLDYWRQRLAGAPAELLPPTDLPRTPRADRSCAQQRLDVPAGLAASLRAMSESEGVPLFVLLYAPFAVLLRRYTNEPDTVVGTPIANRHHAELEDLVGFFANTLVLRTEVPESSTLRDIVRAAAETCFGAYEHQDLPFDLLVEDLRPPRVLNRQPLFQVMFVLQNAPMQWPPLPGLSVETLVLPNTSAKFDLLLEMLQDDDRLVAVFEYADDVFGAATVRRFADHYLDLLAALVTDPDTDVGDVVLRQENAGVQQAPPSPVPELLTRAAGSPGEVEALARYLADGAEVVRVKPDVLASLLGFYAQSDEMPPESLTSVLCLSAGLPRELVDAFYQRFACELYSYFPEEPVLAHLCRPGHEWPILPLGTPIGDAEIVVRDRRRRPVPDGVFGELYLGETALAATGKRTSGGVFEPPQPEIAQADTARAERGRTPTPTEQRLLEVWRDLLGRVDIGLDDGFFALGGHSVLATQLVTRVRALFQVDLSVRTVFEHPTVAGLAKLLSENGSRAETSELLPRSDAGRIPLSPSQERLWFIDQFSPGGSAYTVLAGVRLTGWLDQDAMTAALLSVVRRHEVLRTVFRAPGGTPEQVVLDDLAPRLTVIDLPGAADDAVARVVREQAAEPFDLSAGPLLRVTLVQTSPLRHVLVIAVHHIVCDGWSLGVLLGELADAYAGRSVAPLPVQYSDYVLWQRDRRTEPGEWGERLAGAPALNLPTDRRRPPAQTQRGATHRFTLPTELAKGVAELAADTGCTVFMVALAAFQVLLGRWCGQRDVSVGVPVANRARPELERLVGFFANTLVLRTGWEEGATFEEVLAQVRRHELDAQAHQDFPFERLLESVDFDRDASRTPLFQVACALDNTPMPTVVVPGLVMQPVDFDGESSRFDLTMFVHQRDEALSISLEYSTDLFDAATVEQFARWYKDTLSAVVANPVVQVEELPRPTEMDERVLAEWNDTQTAFDDVTVHELVERQAAETPEAVAVEIGTCAVTFRDLDDRANRLAQQLRRHGVGPERIVAVHAERSVELVVALLAILKSGGAYLPLDPDHPAERNAFVLDDAQPEVVLSQRHLVTPPGNILYLDDIGELPEASAQDSGVSSTNLAYVIYTSGSTGRPKGALNTHRAVSNRLQWMQRRYPIGSADAVLQKTPISFDVSVWEFFWPMLAGARLVLAEPGAHRDVDRIADLVAEHGVTAIHFVPSVLRSFLALEDLTRCATLRHVVCSGEALAADLPQLLHSRLGSQLHNLYGPTEAAIEVTHWTCEPGDERPTVPIGRPIDNLRVFVLDKDLRPVPVGFVGEICLGGVGVGRGYLNRPELTAERFVLNPDGSGALYRTGDFGRFDTAGVLTYLGRMDDQVKLRGVRVELGEIEATLTRHPEVHAAAVIVSGESLVAFAVPERAKTARTPPGLADDVLGHLRAHLPSSMVPGSVVLMSELPVMSNGKLDRAALRSIERVAPSIEVVRPRDGLESALLQAWQDVLGRDGFGVTDDFFALGGHSLLVPRLVARIGELAGYAVPLSALFRDATVERLAASLRAQVPPERIVTLASGPVGAPTIFLVHPIGGHLLGYRPLVSALDGHATVLGMQAPGLDGTIEPLHTVEDLAEHHISLLRERQPKGPYHLAGWSFGGVVAYEMAQRLGEVASLTLIDAHLLTGDAPDDAHALASFAQDLGLDAVPGRLSELIDVASTTGVLPEDTDLTALWELYRANLAALYAYRPQHWGGRAVLIRPKQIAHEHWQELANVDVQVVPGDHYSVVRSQETARILLSATGSGER